MSDIRKILDRKLRLHIIGKTLGTCPRTGESIDIRNAMFVLDRDGDPYMALSQCGWAEVVANGDVEPLAVNGITADLDTIRDPEVREQSIPAAYAKPAPDPDQTALFEVVGEVIVTVDEE